MLPVMALVGRPNVGKSTLFNRLTRSKDALVANFPGLTRDRQYGQAQFRGQKFILIDTGGVTGEEAGIDAHMAQQSMQAIEEADLVLFIIDAKAGCTAGDEYLAAQLRRQSKPVFLVANKIDGCDLTLVQSEVYGLGFGEPQWIAASHGRGVIQLLESMQAQSGVLGFEPQKSQECDFFEEGVVEEASGKKPIHQQYQGIRMAVIGRPNVGKSTLVNRMLGEERVVVFDEPGTTRDSIYIPFERHNKPYTLIDTAGIRRKKNVSEAIEKFSIIKTLQAIADANVVIFTIDARIGLVEQDMHLLGFVVQAGRALVLAVNKWDGMTVEEREKVKADIYRRLGFVDYAKIHFISALHGTNVGHLYESVEKAYECAFAKWPTKQLTSLLLDATVEHQPPVVKGHRIKLRFAHQGGSNPPRIIIHGNKIDDIPGAYRRYLENTFRRVLRLQGTPIQLEFKGGENPYSSKKNTLTPRQIAKKKRLVKHVKKLKKSRN